MLIKLKILLSNNRITRNWNLKNKIINRIRMLIKLKKILYYFQFKMKYKNKK